MTDNSKVIPRFWEEAVRKYGFLSKNHDKLANCPSARETNRKLLDGGHSTEQNPIALLWDCSVGYGWWRFFGIKHGSDELIRYKVPVQCDPTAKTGIYGVSMRDHPDFRIPTFEDFCELYERHDTEGETRKALNKVRENRARYKQKTDEIMREAAIDGMEQALIEVQEEAARGESISMPVEAKIEDKAPPKKTTRRRNTKSKNVRKQAAANG